MSCSSRIEGGLREATVHADKLLRTATPLQNVLIELFGLAIFVDPHLFGDESSFCTRFDNTSALTAAASVELRLRLGTVVTRTLRSQSRDSVRCTMRLTMTRSYEPSADLHLPDIVAFPKVQRALLTLMLRSLLASSSFAIAATLRSLLERLDHGDVKVLESQLRLTDDFVTFDGISEE